MVILQIDNELTDVTANTLNPNPDIESTMIAQVLDAPRKPRKSFMTNEVKSHFSTDFVRQLVPSYGSYLHIKSNSHTLE